MELILDLTWGLALLEHFCNMSGLPLTTLAFLLEQNNKGTLLRFLVSENAEVS